MKMTLTRGLQASGKTTWAKKLVASDPSYVRINRDDFRSMLFGEPKFTPEQEEQVTVVQHAAIKAAFKAGNSVVIDDTNLNDKFVRQLMKIAQSFGAEVEFKDFTDVPLEVCFDRDANRERSVGPNVIRSFYDRYIKGRQLPLPTPQLPDYEIKPYVEREAGPRLFHKNPWAVIVDIDGTIAKMADRSPYDWKRVGEDKPVEDVLSAVRAMSNSGFTVLFTSGRDGSCFNETLAWLEQHAYGMGSGWRLLMRTEKDNRPDWIVKAEIFDKEIRGKYNIRCVFDDRDQVVSMWRRMGLTVFQVAEGDF